MTRLRAICRSSLRRNVPCAVADRTYSSGGFIRTTATCATATGTMKDCAWTVSPPTVPGVFRSPIRNRCREPDAALISTTARSADRTGNTRPPARRRSVRRSRNARGAGGRLQKAMKVRGPSRRRRWSYARQKPSASAFGRSRFQ